MYRLSLALVPVLLLHFVLLAAEDPHTPPPGEIKQPAGALTKTGYLTGTVHKEIDGVVSMEAENAYWWRGCELFHGVSGNALRVKYPRGAAVEAAIFFKVQFSTPGRYALWNLGKIEKVQYAGNEINVVVDCQKEFSSKAAPSDPNCGTPYIQDSKDRLFSRTYPGRWENKDGYGGWNTATYHWSSKLKQGKTSKATGAYAGTNGTGCPCYEEADMIPPAIWNITTAGIHTLAYSAANESGMYFDKLVLKKVDIAVAPTGTGPAETTLSTEIRATQSAMRVIPASSGIEITGLNKGKPVRCPLISINGRGIPSSEPRSGTGMAVNLSSERNTFR